MYNGNFIGEITNGQLPNITGMIRGDTFDDGTTGNAIYWARTGCFESALVENVTYNVASHISNRAFKKTSCVYFNASLSSSIYGAYNETGVVPRSLGMNYIVKY